MDRHLLPHEYDLLLDGETGFGVAPLRAHVRDCPDCAAELEEARAVLAELDRLPHLAPAPLFVDRVMTQVQPFEPWHVALGDAVRRLVPQSRPARALAAAGALSLASLLTVATLWLATRIDLLALVAGLRAERMRATLAAAARDAVGGLLGGGAPDGTLALAAAGIFVLTALGALAGLRRAAVGTGRGEGRG